MMPISPEEFVALTDEYADDVDNAPKPTSSSIDSVDAGDHGDLAEVLQSIPCESTDHEEWMKAGTVLKKYGYPFEVFEAWSATDTRQGQYLGTEHTRRQWDSFDVETEISSGWLVSVAKSHGWTRKPNDGRYGWDDEVELNLGDTILPDGTIRKTGETENEGKDKGGENGADDQKLLLPQWTAVSAKNPPRRSPVLVEGILRRGHVALLAGKAKSGKSWAAIQLAIAVSTGGSWMGRGCERGRVLYIDPELDPRSLDQRFHKVCDALGADATEVDANVIRWSLRGALTKGSGKPPTVKDVAQDLKTIGEKFDLIIIDSCSALLDGDENKAQDVRAFFNVCLRISEYTGASVLCVHHFGKFAAGDRDSIDRARGSSSWVDCPDLVLMLTEVLPPNGKPSDFLQEGERALTLECAAIREFAPVPDARLIYRYPIHVQDLDGITSEWTPKSSQKSNGQKSGEVRKANAEAKRAKCEAALMDHFFTEGLDEDGGISAKEAAEICSDALDTNITSTTLKNLLVDGQGKFVDVWQKSKRRCVFQPHNLPQTEPTQDQLLMTTG